MKHWERVLVIGMVIGVGSIAYVKTLRSNVRASGYQVGSQTMPVCSGSTVAQYQPVQTVGGVCVQMQTGTNPSYGISADTASSGVITVVKYGDYPCLFDAPATSGDTSVPLNGYCHDGGVANDIDVSNSVGVIGKIMQQLPTLGTNYASVTLGYPGRRGAMVSASSLDPTTVPAYIKANQNTSTGPTGATGAAGTNGTNGATGATGPSGTLYYNASGLVSGSKCWRGSTTSTTAGAFSQSISTAGITTLQYVNAMAGSTAATAAGSSQANVVASTTTNTVVNGTVTVPNTILGLGLLATALSTTAQTVWIEACGT